MVPFLAAYIGYSIAERLRWLRALSVPGLVTALVRASWCADRRDYRRHRGALPEENSVHKVLRSVMPIFIIPIVGT